MNRHKRQIQARTEIPRTGQSVQPKSVLNDEIQLSFKYVDPGGEFCLSKCNSREVKQYKECLKKICTYTVQMLYSQSGKGKNAQGLAFEKINESTLTVARRPESLDRSMHISSVRANQGMRLYLTQKGCVFYVLWFDRSHAICKS